MPIGFMCNDSLALLKLVGANLRSTVFQREGRRKTV